jgi:hypothetical protein
LDRATVKNKSPSGYSVVANEATKSSSSSALDTPSETPTLESGESKGISQNEADLA